MHTSLIFIICYFPFFFCISFIISFDTKLNQIKNYFRKLSDMWLLVNVLYKFLFILEATVYIYDVFFIGLDSLWFKVKDKKKKIKWNLPLSSQRKFFTFNLWQFVLRDDIVSLYHLIITTLFSERFIKKDIIRDK